MKRLVMQLMRTIVTVIVVGTMAAMIFALRSELDAARREIATLRCELAAAQAQIATPLKTQPE